MPRMGSERSSVAEEAGEEEGRDDHESKEMPAKKVALETHFVPHL